MSTVLTACMAIKAYHDDEVMKKFAVAFYENLLKGHFSTNPCEHKPPCKELTEKQMEELKERMINYLETIYGE